MSEQFTKTVITVTVLSNGQYNFQNLAATAYDINEGDCSGQVEVTSSTALTREEMAVALTEQGSSPSFLLGDDYEEDVDHDA